MARGLVAPGSSPAAPILLAGLLCLPAPRPARAGKETGLYGGSNPTYAQFANRHLSLLEHALFWLPTIEPIMGEAMDLTLLSLTNKAKADARKANDRAMLALKPDADEQGLAKPGRVFAPAPALAYAADMRAGFEPVAREYLRQSEEGKGPPGKLTLFEQRFLFDSYLLQLSFSREGLHQEVFRESMKVNVPDDQEERYLLESRVSHCRALIRSELSRWLESPPPGMVDPEAEFNYLTDLGKMLIERDKAKLSPHYERAGMAFPELKKPEASPSNPAGEPFIYRFTDQEHAVLAHLTKAAKVQAEFEGDQRKADAQAAEMPRLVAKWREKVLLEVRRELQEPLKDREGAESTIDRLTFFESTYVEERFEKLNPELMRQFRRLCWDASQAASKERDAGAPDRIISRVRALIREDLRAYDPAAKSPDTALTAWAKQNLKADAVFAQLFPKPATGGEGKLDEALARKLPELFQDPVEQAAVEYLALRSPRKEEIRLWIQAANKEALAGEAVGAIIRYLSGQEAGLQDTLGSRGLGPESVLAYYCPQLADSSTAGPHSRAFEELKVVAAQVERAAVHPSPEAAAALAQVEPTSEAVSRCAGWYAEKKKDNALSLKKSEFKPELAFRPEDSGDPPEPEVERDGGGSGAKAKEAIAIGAGGAGGLAILGILGLFLGLGPLGVVALALVGLGLGLYIGHEFSRSKSDD